MVPLAETLLQQWLQQSPQYAILLLDRAGRVVGGAGAVELTLGVSVDALIGHPLTALFTEEDRARGIDRLELETAAASGISEDDRWHRRGDGARVWISGALHALRDPRGGLIGFAKVMRDRTDLRIQTETLERRVQELADADAERKLFLATLGHELRNPLSALQSAGRLLDATVDRDRLRAPLDVMARQLSLLARLADDLVDATRADTGRLRLQCVPLSLGPALQALLRTWGPRAKAHGVALEARLPAAEVTLRADPERFDQMLGNLLHNALKFTPAGGRVWLKATVEADMAVVRVEDDGEGIDAELLPRLFELFTRGPASSHARGAGLGLGLPLVKRLVEAHGGLIEVRSAGRGRGSQFALRLPLHGTPG
jgi:two-component system CheB/CheR fusion protein